MIETDRSVGSVAFVSETETWESDGTDEMDLTVHSAGRTTVTGRYILSDKW